MLRIVPTVPEPVSWLFLVVVAVVILWATPLGRKVSPNPSEREVGVMVALLIAAVLLFVLTLDGDGKCLQWVETPDGRECVLESEELEQAP